MREDDSGVEPDAVENLIFDSGEVAPFFAGVYVGFVYGIIVDTREKTNREYSKLVKFDHFKVRVVEEFPYSEILKSGSAANPVLHSPFL